MEKYMFFLRLLLFSPPFASCLVTDFNFENIGIKGMKINPLKNVTIQLTFNTDNDTVTCSIVLTSILNNENVLMGDANDTMNRQVTIPIHKLSSTIAIHQLVVQLNDSGNVHQISTLLYYEAAVESLLPPGEGFNSLAPVNTTLMLAEEGPNTKLRADLSIEELVNGKITKLFKLYDVISIGNNSMHLTKISSLNVTGTWLITSVQHAINNISVYINTPITNTKANVDIKVKVNPGANLPMGTIHATSTYDDGVTRNGSFIPKLPQDQELNLSRLYAKQGNHSAHVQLTSECNSENYTLEIFIWDDLSLLRFDANPEAIKINDTVTFVFTNIPFSGFLFIADYEIGTYTEENTTVFDFPFNPPVIEIQYTVSNEYNIKLSAWNSMYTKQYSSKLYVQHPITTLDISPKSLIIPYTDTKVVFSIKMIKNKPSPTSASCVFDMLQHTSENFPLNISYDSPITHIYDFKTPGEYDVKITCLNRVSEFVQNISIIVRNFTLNDVELFHRDLIPTNYSNPATNVFRIKILDCIVVSSMLSLTWNFGDGSEVKSIMMSSFTYEHEFPTRGKYAVVLDVNLNGSSRTIHLHQQVGILKYTVSTYLELIDVNITFSASTFENISSPGPIQFEIDYSDGTSVSTLMKHAFKEYGRYKPILRAHNSTLFEYRQIDQYIQIEHPITVLIPDHLAKMQYPSGMLSFKIAIPTGSLYLPYVKCNISYGDDIDKNIYEIEGNLTHVTPLTTNYQYLTLGSHIIKFTCSNLLTNLSNTSNVEILNNCFSVTGIFDRQYAYPSSPMRVYASHLLQITNRMTVYCVNNTQVYRWRIFRLDTRPETEIDLLQPGSDFIEFPKRTFQAGLYRLMMNASFSNLTYRWFVESTYIKFQNPPLRAEITGGKFRVNGMSDIDIDAEELSYDPLYDVSYGNNSIQFSWKCEQIPSKYFEGKQVEFINMNHSIDCANISSVLSPGKLRFYGSEQTDSAGFAFIVHVQKPNREGAVFVQLVQVKLGAPQINLKCVINCEIKTAVSSSLSLMSFCENCANDEIETASFHWKIYILKKDIANFTEIIDSINIFENTGANPSTIVIKRDVLQEDTTYRVELSVIIPDRTAPGFAAYEIHTNLRPYGGTCTVYPDTGIATKTQFRVRCEEWKDDGSRGYRDTIPDLKEPLTYKYFIRKGDFINPLDTGVESTTAELNVPLFPELNGSDYTIDVRIFDILQDFQEYKLPIQLFSPFSTLANLTEVEKIEKLISDNENNLTEVKLTGSSAKFTREVNSVISVIQTVNIPEDQFLFLKTLSDDHAKKQPTWSEIWTDFQAPRDKSTKIRVAISGEGYMQVLSKRKAEMNTLNGQGVTALTQSLTNIVYKPSTTNLETARMGSDMALAAAIRIKDIINTRPFPIKDNIEEALSGVTDFIGHLLLASVPDLKGRVPHVTEESIREQVRETGLGGDQVGEDEATFLAFRISESEKYEIKQKKETSKSMFRNLENSLDTGHDALSAMLVKGQTPKKIKKRNILLQSQKLGSTQLLKYGLQTEEFGVEFPNLNISVDNISQILNIQSTLFKKNPFTWGSNDSSYGVDSPVLQIKIKTDNKTIIKTPLELTITKDIDVQFKNIDVTKVEKNDEGLHFHVGVLKNPRDSMHIYLKLAHTNFKISVIFKLWKLPKDSIGNYDYRTDGELSTLNGVEVYKVFVPSYTFRDAGSLYFGIAFDTGESAKARTRRSANNTSTAISNVTQDAPPTSMLFTTNTQNYEMLISTDGCVVWNAQLGTWDGTACKISKYSTPYKTLCSCYDPPGNSFASSFYVPPNTIDFSAVFTKFDITNAAVYGTVISTLVVFIFAALWAKRKDVHDMNKWKIGYLKDNMVGDDILYLISVQTGLRKNSGCKSNISFIISGEDGDSGVRCLSDGVRYFQTGSVMNFICTTNASLGDLRYLRIWHDNSGEDKWASWYLVKITIEDLQAKKLYIFMVNNWLAVDNGDSFIDRVVLVGDKNELMQFNALFYAHGSTALTDSHVWLSVLYRPEISSFSRVQRVSCCLALLFLTMITNAMFFKSEENTSENELAPTEIRIGIFRLSMSVLYTSVVSLAITLLPTMTMIYMFRLSRTSKIVYGKHKYCRCPCCCIGTRTSNQIIDLEKSAISLSNLNSDQMNYEHQECKSKTATFSVIPVAQGYTVTYDDSSSGTGSNMDGVTSMPSENLPLPYFCVKLAYLLVVLSVVASAFFLITYSMEWGKSKSEEWLTAFFLGFFENVFMVDPVKIVAIAVLFAVCSKNPYTNSVKVELTTVKEEATKHGNQNTVGRQQVPIPMTRQEIGMLQKKRIDTLKAEGAFIQLILYVIFLVGLFIVSLGNRDDSSYQFKNHIDNMVYIGTFDKVKTRESFFMWTNNTLLQSIFSQRHYNGGTMSWQEKLFFSDLANFRVGPVRIRQIRSTKRPTPIYYRAYLKRVETQRDYFWAYSVENRDLGNYCLNWKQKPCPDYESAQSVSAKAWLYNSGSEYKSVVMGELEAYGNEGYFFDMSVNYDVSLKMFNELYQNEWLDRQTRGVFVDFTLYNINLNLITTVRLIAEFPEFGSVFVWRHIDTMRLFQHFGTLGIFNIICDIIIALIMFHFIIKFVKNLFKYKIKFFTDFWNIVDTFNVLISLMVVVFYALRKIYTDAALAKFREDTKQFVDFSSLITWDSIFVCCVGFLVFTTIIGLLRLLGYNKRMTMLGTVLKKSSRDLSSMGIIFGVVFSAFILAGFLLLQTVRKEYLSILSSSLNTFVYMIGRNKLGRILLDLSDSPLYSFYYICMVFFVIFILITMFQAILNSSMTVVRADLNKMTAPYGVVNVVMNIYQTLIGDWLPGALFQPKNKRAVAERKQSHGFSADHVHVMRSVKQHFEDVTALEDTTMGDKMEKYSKRNIFQKNGAKSVKSRLIFQE